MTDTATHYPVAPGPTVPENITSRKPAAPGVHDNFNAEPETLGNIICQGDNEYPIPSTPRARQRLVTGAGLTNEQLAAGMSSAVGGAFKGGHVQLVIDIGD